MSIVKIVIPDNICGENVHKLHFKVYVKSSAVTNNSLRSTGHSFIKSLRSMYILPR